MQEQTLAQKQDYLSKEIIEQGFDPEEFQDFMLENSNKELDLNLWTLRELKMMVAQYKRHSFIGSEEPEESLYSKEPEMKDELEGQEIQEKDEIRSLPPFVNSSLYKHFTYIKKCEFPKVYHLVHSEKKDIRIKVRNYSKATPTNIFKSAYVIYDIETSLNTKVHRRFTDFVWFHKSLQQAYPGFPIPPIPEKTTFRSFDEKHIETRMMIFERFLSTLVKIPEICSDEIVEDFLFCEMGQNFSKKKKLFEDKINEMRKKDEIHSLLGDEVLLSNSLEIEQAQISFYHSSASKYDELVRELWNLQENLKKVTVESNHISKQFSHLSEKIGLPNSEETLAIISSISQSLSEHFEILSVFMRNKLTSIWQYEKLYCRNMAQLMEGIKKDQRALNQQHKSIIKTSDEIYSSFISSQEPNRSLKEYQIAKEKYKLKLSHTIREVKRYEKHEFGWVSREWSAGLQELIGKVNELVVEMADETARSLCVWEGKKMVEVEYVH